jgi:hypothetical protein
MNILSKHLKSSGYQNFCLNEGQVSVSRLNVQRLKWLLHIYQSVSQPAPTMNWPLYAALDLI